jgi:phosphoribosyl 1,2-cyclic phosphodiesterase
MKNEFKVKFRGVRGSVPVPGLGTVRYGGNTTCIEVRVNGHLIIFDAGTGIINLGQELMGSYMKMDENARTKNPITATMFFTHTHLDHVLGLPFFTPVYVGNTRLFIFGGKYYDKDFRESLAKSMHSPLFPVEFDDLPSLREVNNVKEGEVILLRNGNPVPELQNVFRPTTEFPEDAVKIYAYQSYAHPCDGVLVYRVEFRSKKLVFATDIEGYKVADTRLVNFAKNVDLLVHDAQYTNEEYLMAQGYGHSTMDMAAEVAAAANVKKLALFHHDPKHNDDKLDEIHSYTKGLFPNTIMAIENAEIDMFAEDEKVVPVNTSSDVA